ncbi:MAG: hypothetical protein K6E10_09420 [Eubacterium sp.]|nr:hypothetical protein [Eubacterium sp.]
MNVREVAFDILKKVEDDNLYVNDLLGNALRIHQFEDKRDRAFLTRLVEGVTERKLSLDFLINKFSAKGSNKKIKPDIRIILRMGIYQIRYMDQIPNRAVIAEAVEMTKSKGYQGLSGYVNGLLRNVDRVYEEGKLDSYLVSNQESRYSTPMWICRLLTESYGKEKTRLILEDQYREHDTVIRVNQYKISTDEYKKRLIEKGIKVEDGLISGRCLRISGYDSISRLPGYRDGLFIVQDETSVYAIEHAGIKPGDKVLDLCSAPGGKSLLAYELSDSGIILSRDISQKKISLIEENAQRMGIPFLVMDQEASRVDDLEMYSDNKKIASDNKKIASDNKYISGINIEIRDANILDKQVEGLEARDKFDVVLSDVPCSGLGIIGRKNDIKYHVTEESIRFLAEQGLGILKNASHYVKDNGSICYSTCTINPSENGEVVKAFLESEEGNDFVLVEDKTFLQGIDGSDGFYYAILRKACNI